MTKLLGATLAVAALTLTACGSGTTTSTSGAAQLDDGARIYAERCASCHGAELEGTNQGPPHRSIVYEPGHHPDESFRQAIANGVRQHHWPFGDMPPVDGLSEQDVAAVIAFVRTEQNRLGFLE